MLKLSYSFFVVISATILQPFLVYDRTLSAISFSLRSILATLKNTKKQFPPFSFTEKERHPVKI